jgi:hypothetical protein
MASKVNINDNCPFHRYPEKSRLLKFCYVPGASAAFSKGFLWYPLTVFTRQKMQVVSAINQSIFLRCLWSLPWPDGKQKKIP